MSSGKPWANNSCMDVERNTGQAGSVFRHIRHGALVAYLVDTGQEEMDNAYARMNIIPFFSSSDLKKSRNYRLGTEGDIFRPYSIGDKAYITDQDDVLDLIQNVLNKRAFLIVTQKQYSRKNLKHDTLFARIVLDYF